MTYGMWHAAEYVCDKMVPCNNRCFTSALLRVLLCCKII